MVAITDIRNIKGDYDEVWAVTRSSKRLPDGARHVPELSPSWELFNKFRKWKEDGTWDAETFQEKYAPQFLAEMESPAARAKLDELVSKSQAGKRICIFCFCADEALCHRSLLAGLLSPRTKVCGCGPCQVKKSMAFTGPRPNKLCGYDTSRYVPFVRQMEEVIAGYCKEGFRKFLFGGAQGFDQLAFWAAIGVKQQFPDLETVIYVPFPGQESIWKKDGCFGRTEYSRMLSMADKVIFVQDETPPTKALITEALFGRNVRMISDATAVFALCQHSDWELGGGTAHAIRYAKSHARIVYRAGYDIGETLHMHEPEIL